jgi:predicted Zn-dependent protease
MPSRAVVVKIIKPLIALSLVACLSISLSCFRRPEYVPLNTKSLKGSGKVFFVPLGDFPSSEVERLVTYYRNKYGLSIETLPSLPLDSSVVNPERKQLIAEAVIDLMKNGNPSLVADRQAILIGLTTEDMYIQKYDWRFSFSWRQEGRYAVVSNARMNLGASSISEEKLNSRLRKMVTKNIGIMYYGLQQSNDPRSVLYKDIGGISELDYMGEDF